MPVKEPVEGTEETASLLVEPGDLASALHLADRDKYPPVFATSRMIALMEIASARILQPCLSDNELSVGVNVQATHSAATPPGQTVTAHSRYIGRDGKLYRFHVTVHDKGGKVGHAVHDRAIVLADKLEASAFRRCAL